jgi:hypothetical protein
VEDTIVYKFTKGRKELILFISLVVRGELCLGCPLAIDEGAPAKKNVPSVGCRSACKGAADEFVEHNML